MEDKPPQYFHAYAPLPPGVPPPPIDPRTQQQPKNTFAPSPPPSAFQPLPGLSFEPKFSLPPKSSLSKEQVVPTPPPSSKLVGFEKGAPIYQTESGSLWTPTPGFTKTDTFQNQSQAVALQIKTEVEKGNIDQAKSIAEKSGLFQVRTFPTSEGQLQVQIAPTPQFHSQMTQAIVSDLKAQGIKLTPDQWKWAETNIQYQLSTKGEVGKDFLREIENLHYQNVKAELVAQEMRKPESWGERIRWGAGGGDLGSFIKGLLSPAVEPAESIYSKVTGTKFRPQEIPIRSPEGKIEKIQLTEPSSPGWEYGGQLVGEFALWAIGGAAVGAGVKGAMTTGRGASVAGWMARHPTIVKGAAGTVMFGPTAVSSGIALKEGVPPGEVGKSVAKEIPLMIAGLAGFSTGYSLTAPRPMAGTTLTRETEIKTPTIDIRQIVVGKAPGEVSPRWPTREYLLYRSEEFRPVVKGVEARGRFWEGARGTLYRGREEIVTPSGRVSVAKGEYVVKEGIRTYRQSLIDTIIAGRGKEVGRTSLVTAVKRGPEAQEFRYDRFALKRGVEGKQVERMGVISYTPPGERVEIKSLRDLIGVPPEKPPEVRGIPPAERRIKFLRDIVGPEPEAKGVEVPGGRGQALLMREEVKPEIRTLSTLARTERVRLEVPVRADIRPIVGAIAGVRMAEAIRVRAKAEVRTVPKVKVSPARTVKTKTIARVSSVSLVKEIVGVKEAAPVRTTAVAVSPIEVTKTAQRLRMDNLVLQLVAGREERRRPGEIPVGRGKRAEKTHLRVRRWGVTDILKIAGVR